MAGLALGYFLCYIPFAALTKALSSGLVPGVDERVGGLVLLPAAAIGFLIGMIVFLTLNGWWRHIGLRPVRGRLRRMPSRATVTAGVFMALIVSTTIVNYTFAGVAILFMLLMMRAGTLGLAPIVDAVRRRPVRAYSWVALALSLLAVAVALGGVETYTLTLGALVSLGLYFAGYIGRFEIMSRVAKTGEEQTARRYLTEEGIAAAGCQLLICAALALVAVGEPGAAIREGFTSFLFEPAALIAVGVGLLYASLYVFGTLIYLDPREYSWCVPVNRGASLFSVLVASYLLTWLFGVEPPHESALAAAALVLAAIAALSYPRLRNLVTRAKQPEPALILFVCRGNRGRSPIAAALARAVLARAKPGTYDAWLVHSAGVEVRSPGARPHREALDAARQLGLSLDLHGAQPLTRELCERADAIFCMTEEQRESVLRLAPFARAKTQCLDPDGPLPEPPSGSVEAWRASAARVGELVFARLNEIAQPTPAKAVA